MIRVLMAAALALAPVTAFAQQPPSPKTFEAPATLEPAMTLDTLHSIIMALDPQAQTNGTLWQLTINGVEVMVITDANADRMRAMAYVREAAGITPEEMTRMMQANFDSALDTRYALAQDKLWAVFIHPLSPLEKNEFVSGLGQTVNAVTSYGTLYTGGALQYGGGDSGALQRELIDDLLNRAEPI